ncbi:methyltransferase-like protein [Acrasis kona]|uniref:Methyltransferase-like protein n=1 Tax=Acrasis kona TaxID=1008807 RepID=A0AAW2ZKD0_9EUKA
MGNQHGNAQQEMAEAVRNIWLKDISELPVSKDLPRLAKKIKIHDSVNDVINYIDQPTDEGELKPSTPTEIDGTVGEQHRDEVLNRCMYSIVMSMSQELRDFNQNMSGMTLQMFEREINVTDHKSIQNFLTRNFGNNGRVVKVLKACNQSIIAPPVTQLKKLLLDKIDYKDVKGEWTINIHISPVTTGHGEDRREDVSVIVAHRKKEQVLVKRKITYELVYQFEWEFTIRFTRNVEDIESISLRLGDILFNGERDFKDEEKQDIKNMLKDIIVDQTVTYDEQFFKKSLKAAKNKKNT